MTGSDAIRIIKALGVSQAEFARCSGVHQNTICNWSRGREKPSAAAAALLILLRERPELLAVLQSARIAA